jgi:hypothetical protein
MFCKGQTTLCEAFGLEENIREASAAILSVSGVLVVLLSGISRILVDAS